MAKPSLTSLDKRVKALEKWRKSFDIPPKENPPMPAAVPYTTNYWANMVEWAGYLKDWFATNKLANPPYGQDPALTQEYYDGEWCAYKVKDHQGGVSTYDQWIQDEFDAYAQYYVIPANGGTQGFRMFTEGFVEDGLRSTTRAATAKSALQLILDNSNFVRQDDLSDDLLSRECAYSLMAIINGRRMGCTIDATVNSRESVLLGWCLGHIDQWCTLMTADYYRPFMGGITAHALTHYFLFRSEDSRILPRLITLANYTWSACWKGTAGAWGDGLSFLYTDRFVVDSNDTTTQPDLNMMICPLWGFLWWKTGNAAWRQNGDLIFQGSITVYSGGFWQSGAYLGTQSSSNPAGKQYDQQLVWGTKYLDWALLSYVAPATSGGGTGDNPSKSKSQNYGLL